MTAPSTAPAAPADPTWPLPGETPDETADRVAAPYAADPDIHATIRFLAWEDAIRARCGPRPDGEWPTRTALLLAHTRPERAPLGLPPGIPAGEPRACWKNAHRSAFDHGLVYVEGWARAAFMPVQHAWCVDPDTGRIVDPTWAERGNVRDAVYAGIRFSLPFVAEHVSETRSYPVLAALLTDGRALRHGFTVDATGAVTGLAPRLEPGSA